MNSAIMILLEQTLLQSGVLQETMGSEVKLFDRLSCGANDELSTR
ncbi:hypothetical protein [Pseudoalteromonas umbrosa]|nr:hypothetical protein [Pseudoalteromonas sp. B95]MDK1285736.1 hypothetical protein [Pseudoalteromonas sp. B95]